MNYIDPHEQFLRMREEELAAQRKAIEHLQLPGNDRQSNTSKQESPEERDRLWQLIQQASRN
jgi:hypothetical protein